MSATFRGRGLGKLLLDRGANPNAATGDGAA
jgi:hypothetical protein